MMAAVVKISCSLGVLKLRTLFLSVSPFFFVVNSSCQTFYEAFTCLIRNYVTNIFKTERHVEQNKENKSPVRSPVCLDSNRSWATTNHNTHSIQIIVSRVISLFRSTNHCIHHSTLLNIAWSVALETSSTTFILPSCLCLNLISNAISSLYQGVFECSVTVHALAGATWSNLIIFSKLN